MYQGHNPTALRSQLSMAEALMRLMEKKEYEGITITEICREAGCSRQTFYQLFSCKDDILRFGLRSFFAKLHREMAEGEIKGLKETVSLFLRHVAEISSQGKFIIKNGLSYILFEEMLNAVQEALEKSIIGQSRETLSYAGAFLAGAMGSTVLHWLQSDYKMSVDELAELICRLLGTNHIEGSAV